MAAAYGGDNHNMQGGSGTASWTFTGLDSGQYQVAATWSHIYNNNYNTLDAPFGVEDGSGAVLATATVNQKNAPSEFAYDGYNWDTLGTANITGGINEPASVMPDAQAWLFYSAACKGIVNSHGVGRNVLQRAAPLLGVEEM